MPKNKNANAAADYMAPGSGTTPEGRVCNLRPSTGTETDWSLGDIQGAGLLAAVALPASVDLRTSWWKIGDQGYTGSCVGWAAAHGVGWYMMKMAGKVRANQKLSPRYLWMASKETDEFTMRPTSFVELDGTSLKAATDVARKFGFALESDVPFKISTVMYTGNENALYASNAQRRISYANLGKDPVQWRTWLTQKGPLMAGLQVDATWNSGGNAGVMDTFQPATVVGGHAVCICGYREDGTFIVRNSWGTGWGDAGFAYITPAYLQAAFFPESYGMLVA